MLKQIAGATLLFLAVVSVEAADPQSVTLDVKGMDCPTCPITIKTVLKKLPGVSEVKVDFKKATAEITFDPAKVTAQKLAASVTEAGFRSTPRQ